MHICQSYGSCGFCHKGYDGAMKRALIQFLGWFYRKVARPVIFLFPSEPIHEFLLTVGYWKSRVPGVAALGRAFFTVSSPALTSRIAGMDFANPIGLAAGFDYRAALTRLLPALGFGFGTIGTLTNNPYEGNPPPRLGRLPKSQALFVNKGFKNEGIAQTLNRHRGRRFTHPVGVSIGRTNTRTHKTQQEAIEDVVAAFQKAEASGVGFSYYELNISCPNLHSSIEFYDCEKLRELLFAVTQLRLSRPVFVKMPIDRSDRDFTKMLDVIAEFPIAGVIIGNLQKRRDHPSLVPEEVAAWPKGNFGGRPTVEDSERYIALAYHHTKGKLLIIGCGGVFTADDAYRKIQKGASLIQLASGLVFMGPTVASEICLELETLLRRDGYTNYLEAVGKDVK